MVSSLQSLWGLYYVDGVVPNQRDVRSNNLKREAFTKGFSFSFFYAVDENLF